MTSIIQLKYLIKRNIKLYFKDKITFFTSLISPLILLVLFVAFLRRVYVDSFLSTIPSELVIDDKIVNGFVAGWLISALLSVSCVTLAFCSSTIMIDDKIKSSIIDIDATPVKKWVISLSYLISTFLTTMILVTIIFLLGIGYIAISGWYLTLSDVLLSYLVTTLITAFGSILASLIVSKISTQGGLSGVSSIVSSMYGFVAGAYMPISQMGSTFASIICFNPGTYGSILLKNYFMGGVINKLETLLPPQAINALKDGFDLNYYAFNNQVNLTTMYLVLIFSILALAFIYLLIHVFKEKKIKNKKN